MSSINLKQTISLFIIYFCAISCSLIIELSQKEKIYKVKKDIFRTYCPETRKKVSSFIVDHPSLEINFRKLIDKLKRLNIELSFIEKSVLLTFLQINTRYDFSSPTSHLQMLINHNGKQQYWDFNTNKTYAFLQSLNMEISSYEKYFSPLSAKKKEKELVSKEEKSNDTSFKAMPFLYGLQTILSYYKAQYTILELAQLLDKHFTYSLTVDKIQVELSNKEESNKEESSKITLEERISVGQKLPKIHFANMVENYLMTHKKVLGSQIYTSEGTLYTLKNDLLKKQKGNIEVSCSYDLKSYLDLKYTNDPTFVEGNFFAFQDHNENSFMALSSKTDVKSSLSSTFCFINQSWPFNFKISLISSDGRNPSQHVYHLLQNNFSNIRSIYQFNELLKKARYLLLVDPLRLIVESQLMDKKQSQELFDLEIPIYNAFPLGNIYTHITTNKTSRLVIDSRKKDFLSCGQKADVSI